MKRAGATILKSADLQLEFAVFGRYAAESGLSV
jgi:hypothetical protein